MFSVRRSPELRALVLAFSTAERRIRNGMRREGRREANATWRPTLRARPLTKLQARVLVPGARANVGSDGSLTLLAATRTSALKGGLVPEAEWHGPELGAIQYRQFGRRMRDGKVVFPAARRVGPRVVAAFVRGAVGGLLAGTEAETTGG